MRISLLFRPSFDAKIFRGYCRTHCIRMSACDERNDCVSLLKYAFRVTCVHAKLNDASPNSRVSRIYLWSAYARHHISAINLANSHCFNILAICSRCMAVCTHTHTQTLGRPYSPFHSNFNTTSMRYFSYLFWFYEVSHTVFVIQLVFFFFSEKEFQAVAYEIRVCVCVWV